MEKLPVSQGNGVDPDGNLDPFSKVVDEINQTKERYENSVASGAAEKADALLAYPPYRSSILRSPTKDPHHVDPEQIELFSPAFGHHEVNRIESDLTAQALGEPLGERIIVTGRVLDAWGRPIANQLVEIWQANASGRYIHKRDRHPAPLDPNFTGLGRCITDSEGRYRFQTIRPGAYPWRNHVNAWRPAHIHFSLFGTSVTQRIITQMYFPNDPLLAIDPIYQAIVDKKAADRLISKLDPDVMEHEWALGYSWDIVLGGSKQTWFEPENGDH
jgi:protocatechuate 3,4-dioxygenase, beta subunit